MNPQKRQQRLNELLTRLKNNADVPNRDLKLVLTESQYAEMQAQWQIEKSFRKITKPKEIKRYEMMLKQATLSHIKYEAYKFNPKRKIHVQEKMKNHAKHLFEIALEATMEIGGKGQALRVWFDRDIDGEIIIDVGAEVSEMPRIKTSKSIFANSFNDKFTKRDIKILVIEQALNEYSVNDELNDAMDAIKSIKTKPNLKDIKF